MAKNIKPPPGFEWLEEDPPRDEWMPWREYPAQIAAVVYPNEDKNNARRKVRNKIKRAIRGGKIAADNTGERVRTLSFWRWVHREYPSVSLPFHPHWVRTTLASGVQCNSLSGPRDCHETALLSAAKELPPDLRNPLIDAFCHYQEKV